MEFQSRMHPSEPSPLPLWVGPLALLLALFSQVTPLCPDLLSFVVRLFYHEVGHALVFWLSSRIAIPSIGATLALHQERSLVVFFVLATCIIATAAYAWRRKALTLAVGSFLTLLLLVLGTFVLSDSLVECVVLYGGLGGEFYLGAAAMLSAYQSMPRRFNWGVNRYLFLVTGALSFAAASVDWLKIRAGARSLPMGAMLDLGGFMGNRESMGDLDRLMREFGWTVDRIVSVYVVTGVVTAVVLVVGFLLVMRQRLRQRPADV